MGTMMERERLAAYVDGALEPEEAAGVVMHLADHPDDQAHVDRIGALNRMLAAAYSAPLDAPHPERLRAAIGGPQVVPLPVRRRMPPLAGLALAAVVVAGLALLALRDPAADADLLAVGTVAPETGLFAALETMPSGRTEDFGENGALTMIGTFRSPDAGYCREIEVTHSGSDVFSRAIACRGSDGWEVAVSVSEPIRGPDGGAGYQPAGGTSVAALGAALDALQAGPSLSPAEERELIAAGWEP